jgi:hypothetical protein
MGVSVPPCSLPFDYNSEIRVEAIRAEGKLPKPAKGWWTIDVRGTTRLTSAAIGEVLNRVCDEIICLMSANATLRQRLFRESRPVQN